MHRVSRVVVVGVAAGVAGGWASPALGDTAQLGASRDNTLYQDPGGLYSNGIGPGMFTGTIATGEARRALVAFDVSSIPAGSTITGVTLRLTADRQPPGAPASTIRVHRVTREWGEGTSNAGQPGGAGTFAAAGDATWVHAMYPSTNWTNVGGDFASATSAAATTEALGLVEWSGPGLVADVQSWLNGTAGSFGWILVSNEADTSTARRFATRESATVEARPQLVVEYVVPGPGALGLLGVGGVLAWRRRR